MKIGPIDSKPPGAVPIERKARHVPTTSPPVPSTEVALSPAATGLGAATTDGTFDGAKVQRIAGAIRDGKFTVNAEAIADKLIVNAKELLGRKLS